MDGRRKEVSRMSKYIIDVGEAYVKHICGEGDMLCLPVRINEFEDNWLNTNIPLTSYTEPDLEQVREEAYEKGWKEAEDHYEKGYNDGYDTGLSHAWEAARNVVALSTADRRKVFGSEYMYSILEKHTASEAIEKIRQYEQEQEEIQVGDEVRNVKSGWTAVVTRISDDDCLTLMDGNGAIADGYEITRFTKTGRHFPKLVALQEEMRLR